MTILVVLSSRHLTIACTKTVDVRPNLNCAIPVEIPYYGANVGRKDICGHCGCAETQIDLELKKNKQYKTVLPMCAACQESGKLPITHRKY